MTRTFLTLPAGSAADHAVPHVVLVGLPGAGKTTVGRAVAEALARPYLDFDMEIERREGMSIGDLFATQGEPAFRALERQLTDELAQTPGGMVLAPGGGWIMVPGALAALRPPAVMVWLKVRPEEALRRMGSERARRPLLVHPNPQGELQRLLAEREPVYKTADLAINTEMMPLARIVDRIVELVKGPAGLAGNTPN